MKLIKMKEAAFNSKTIRFFNVQAFSAFQPPFSFFSPEHEKQTPECVVLSSVQTYTVRLLIIDQ